MTRKPVGLFYFILIHSSSELEKDISGHVLWAHKCRSMHIAGIELLNCFLYASSFEIKRQSQILSHLIKSCSHSEVSLNQDHRFTYKHKLSQTTTQRTAGAVSRVRGQYKGKSLQRNHIQVLYSLDHGGHPQTLLS